MARALWAALLAWSGLLACGHATSKPEPVQNRSFAIAAPDAFKEVERVFASHGLSLMPTDKPNVFITAPTTEISGKGQMALTYNRLVEKRSWLVVLDTQGGRTAVRVYRITQDDWTGSVANLGSITGGHKRRNFAIAKKEFDDSVENTKNTLNELPLPDDAPRDPSMEGEVDERLESVASVETVDDHHEAPPVEALPPAPVAKPQEPPPAFADTCGLDTSPIDAFFQRGNLLLLGEQLGTEEEPQAAGRVLCAALHHTPEVVLGLSVPAAEQKRINAFLQSPGGPMDRKILLLGRFWRRAYQDGRSSEAVFKLVDQARTLRARGYAVSVLAFDTQGAQGNQRTAMMATRVEAFRKLHPSALIILFGGNAQMGREKISLGDSEYLPLGQRLAQVDPEKVLAIDTRFGKGKHWACHQLGPGKLKCEPFELPRSIPPETILTAAERDAGPRMIRFHKPEDGFDGFLWLPEGTPSPPADPAAR